ncbi:hypothetical protein VPH35_108440 [Triticum aestivum]
MNIGEGSKSKEIQHFRIRVTAPHDNLIKDLNKMHGFPSTSLLGSLASVLKLKCGDPMIYRFMNTSNSEISFLHFLCSCNLHLQYTWRTTVKLILLPWQLTVNIIVLYLSKGCES